MMHMVRDFFAKAKPLAKKKVAALMPSHTKVDVTGLHSWLKK